MKPNAASERSGISECDEGARKQTLSEPSPNSSCTINALERPSFRLLPPVFTSSSQRFRLAVFSAGNEVRNPVRRQSARHVCEAPLSPLAFSQQHLFLTIGPRRTNGGIQDSTARNRSKAWANHHAMIWEGV
jgi:hypothetical protein